MNRKNEKERSRSLICSTICEELNKTTQNHDKNNGCAGRDVNVGSLRKHRTAEKTKILQKKRNIWKYGRTLHRKNRKRESATATLYSAHGHLTSFCKCGNAGIDKCSKTKMIRSYVKILGARNVT